MEEQKQKIIVQKRQKKPTKSARRTKETSLDEDNPLLHQKQIISTGMKMLSRQQEEATLQNEISKETKKFHAFTEERLVENIRDSPTEENNSFVASIVNRFR